MMAIAAYPRCAAYLHGMGIRTDDPEMQDKHFAWLLGDAAFNENELTSMGAAELGSAQWGKLLPAMEACLASRKPRGAPGIGTEQRYRLIGLMSTYGIKGSMLKGKAEAIYEVANILWPDDIPRGTPGQQRVLDILNKMPKKYRVKTARENLHRVPRKYFGEDA